MKKQLNVGDAVCWSQRFLTATNTYTSSAANRLGVVVDVGSERQEPLDRMVRVKWDDGPEHWVREENLWDATRRHLEPR